VPMARIIAHELEVYGSHGMQAHRYGDMLAMIETGKLAPQRLIMRHIGLDEAPQALMDMDKFQGTGVTLIKP
jgi:alcohol dehydrogenase